MCTQVELSVFFSCGRDFSSCVGDVSVSLRGQKPTGHVAVSQQHKVRPILCHSGYGGSYAGSWVLCQCPGRTDTSKAEIEILILVEKDLGMLT